MSKEPILFLVIGGMPLAYAAVAVLRAFGVHINEAGEAALYSLWTVVLATLARLCVTPNASLPAGTLDTIAANKLTAQTVKETP